MIYCHSDNDSRQHNDTKCLSDYKGHTKLHYDNDIKQYVKFMKTAIQFSHRKAQTQHSWHKHTETRLSSNKQLAETWTPVNGLGFAVNKHIFFVPNLTFHFKMSSKQVQMFWLFGWPWGVWSGSPGTWTEPYRAVGSPVSRSTSWPAPAPLDPCHWQHPKEPGSPLIGQKQTRIIWW